MAMDKESLVIEALSTTELELGAELPDATELRRAIDML
jgi:hypothetical protein